jgi:ParB family transcriptional regulator, chromosome partitioning protein
MTKKRYQPNFTTHDSNPLIDQIIRREHTLYTIPLNKLHPDPNNPRKHIDDNDLTYLAQDIQTNGLINPIIVTPHDNDTYRIVAGERRYRALQINQTTETNVVIIQPHEAEAIQTAENIHRTDLTPIEEARLYAKLAAKHSLSTRALAERINKDRNHIDRRLRILKFPPEIIQFIEEYPKEQSQAARIAEIDDEKQRLKALRELRYQLLDPTSAPKRPTPPKTLWTQRQKRDGSTNITITYHPQDIPEIITRLQDLLNELTTTTPNPTNE